MNRNDVLQMVGLATKAGKTVSGEFSTEKAVKEGKARLVIVAEDASANTRKLFSDKCSYYGVPYMVYGTKTVLGAAMGNLDRASLAVIDKGFAQTLIKKAETNQVTVNHNGGR